MSRAARVRDSLPVMRGQGCTSLRDAPIWSSSRFSPNCGWVSSSVSHPSSSRCISRPGSTTAPFGKKAIVLSSSAVAGIDPVEPAAITGPLGGDFSNFCASARSFRVPYSGRHHPRFPRPGFSATARAIIFRNEITSFQCAARSAGREIGKARKIGALRHRLIEETARARPQN